MREPSERVAAFRSSPPTLKLRRTLFALTRFRAAARSSKSVGWRLPRRFIPGNNGESLIIPSVERNIKYAGYTLIELLIASAIGTCLLAGLVKYYLMVSENFRFATALMTVQENARCAVDIIQTALDSAGYLGCRRASNSFPIYNANKAKIFDLAVPFFVIPASSPEEPSVSMPTEIKSRRIMGSDVLRVYGVFFKKGSLVQKMADKSLLRIKNENFEFGDFVMVSDCETAEMFEVSAVDHISNYILLHSKQTLSKRYQPPALVGKLEQRWYFVGKTERFNSSGNPITALYENRWGKSYELLEGIEKLSVYVKNSNTIHVTILVNSIQPADSVKHNYIFKDKTYIPVDKLLHKQWQFDLKLRNTYVD